MFGIMQMCKYESLYEIAFLEFQIRNIWICPVAIFFNAQIILLSTAALVFRCHNAEIARFTLNYVTIAKVHYTNKSYPRTAPRIASDPIFNTSVMLNAPSDNRQNVIDL
jgi:hypothetical protein